MAAYFQQTGVVDIFVGVPPAAAGYAPAGQPLFLGQCEIRPELGNMPHWDGVFSNVGGRSTPLDYMFSGEEATLTADLNRFSQPVLDVIMSCPRFRRNINVNPLQGLQAGVQGTTTFLDRGALLLQNNLAIQVWARYKFFGTINQVDAMNPGRFFPAMFVEDVYDVPGLEPRKVRVQFHAANFFNSCTGAFVLYREDVAAFQALSGIATC